jgi:hypothetical protein
LEAVVATADKLLPDNPLRPVLRMPQERHQRLLRKAFMDPALALELAIFGRLMRRV